MCWSTGGGRNSARSIGRSRLLLWLALEWPCTSSRLRFLSIAHRRLLQLSHTLNMLLLRLCWLLALALALPVGEQGRAGDEVDLRLNGVVVAFKALPLDHINVLT